MKDTKTTVSRIITDEKHKKPYFSFVNYSEDKYGFKELQHNDYKALLHTLHKLSKLDWSEIEKSDRHACGTEKINRNSLKVNIPPVYDNKNIIAFRYNGNAPMLCVRDGFCVDILFTDPKFTIYDHD